MSTVQIIPGASLKRIIRAWIRDFQVLLREAWISLVVFIVTLSIGGLLLDLFYIHPETGQSPEFGEALYAAYSMIFFGLLLPYPSEGWVRVIFVLVPLVGLSSAASGVIQFIGAVLSKRTRGQKWQVAMASTYRNHVIVCGVGRVGYRVTMELLKLGREVVAIERVEEARFIAKVRDMGVPVLTADARSSESLLAAGLKEADVIIPCTDDELANLDIALEARELRPDIKVVLRMFDHDLARRIEKGFGIHTAFSTSALSAPIFAAAAMRVPVRHSFYVDDELMNLSEVTLCKGAEIIGWTVEEIEQRLDLSVVYHNGETSAGLHPSPALTLCVDDTIVVLASLPALRRLGEQNVLSG